MQFEGAELVKLVLQTATLIEVRDGRGNLRGSLDQKAAAQLAKGGDYAGVGNRRRIRHLRPLSSVVRTQASQTVRREKVTVTAPRRLLLDKTFTQSGTFTVFEHHSDSFSPEARREYR